MFIHYKSVISFDPVKEMKAMEKFQAEHTDWKRDNTTIFVTFTKERMIRVELKGGEND